MKFSFKAKMFFASVSMAIVLSGFGFFFFSTINYIDQNVRKVVDINLSKLKYIGFIQTYTKEAGLQALLIPGNLNNKDKISELESDFIKSDMRYKEMKAKFDELPTQDEEQKIIEKMQTKWAGFHELVVKAFSMAKATQSEESKKNVEIFVNDEVDTIRVELDDVVSSVASFQSDDADKVVNQISEYSSSKKKITLFSVLAGSIIALVMGYWFAKWISNQLSAVTLKLNENSETLMKAADELMKQSQNMDEQIASQASSVQETMAASEEITSMVKRTSEGTEFTVSSTSKAADSAEEGNIAVHQMEDSMTELGESFNRITAETEKRYNDAKKIAKLMEDIKAKTSVVNEIVFQTKLLSFNASVEAQGRRAR